MNEEYLKSDAVGYNISNYIYHTTLVENIDNIKNNGFIPKDGISIDGKEYENRIYFATSLIAAYDISHTIGVRGDEYAIFKLTSNYIIKNGYEKDTLFLHGIYVNYPVDKKYIIDMIYVEDIFAKFDGEDLDALYL